MILEPLWEAIAILRALYSFITHSPFAFFGGILLLASIVLSAINGLIKIAIYLTLFGGILLFIIALSNFFFPGLIPLWIPLVS